MLAMIPPTDLPAGIVGEAGKNGKQSGRQSLRQIARGKSGNCEMLVQLGGYCQCSASALINLANLLASDLLL
jgi:hypothetical protein